jgi:hypothetical protein
MKFQIPNSKSHLKGTVLISAILALIALLQAPMSVRAADDACASFAVTKGFTGSCKPSLCGQGEQVSTDFISGSPNPCSGTSICCIVAPAGATAAVQTQAGAAAAGTPAAGAATIQTQGYGLINPLGARTIPTIIGQAVAWLGSIAGSLFFAYLIWGGIEWMTAAGNAERLKKGQQRIIAAVFGIVIVLVAYLVVDSIVGVNLLP